MATAEQALAALEPLTDAGSGRSLLELGWIQQVRVQGNRVVFRLALPGYATSQRERIAADARGPCWPLGALRMCRSSWRSPALPGGPSGRRSAPRAMARGGGTSPSASPSQA